MKFRLLALALATALAACSTDEDPDDAPDTTERDTSDRDTTPPDAETDPTPDAPDTPDAPEEVEETSDAPVETTPDTLPRDARPLDCEVESDECTPSAIYCVPGEQSVGFCSRCGEVLRTEPCDALEVCEVSGGAARCRPCVGDECPDIDACEPSTRACLDFNTVQICGPDGEVDSVADCASGRRCFGGSCGAAGNTTGAACTKNLDPTTGCNGHACICGEEFAATEAGSAWCGARASVGDGYCSTSDCVSNGCDYASETCVEFGISGSMDGGAYCVRNEGCSRRGASCGSRAGFQCQELPGRRGATAPVTWGWACWPPLRNIGETCASDADCVGGECRVATVGGASVSYCAMPCGPDATCPSYAACVADPDASSGYVCLAHSTSADCPRMDTEPLRIAPTPPLARYGAGRVSVCYFAR